MADTQSKRPRTGLYAGVVVVLLGLFGLFKIFGPGTGNRSGGEFVYIHTGSDYSRLRSALQDGGFVTDFFTFDLIARAFKLPEHVRPGKYRVRAGMSRFAIARMLRNGSQTQVKLVVNKLRTQADFCHLLCSNLEIDSLKALELLNNNVYLAPFGLDSATVMCGIMQDTYNFYWNVTADNVFRKIFKNYSRYWDDTHKQEAQNKGLTPQKAIILASIVDEESNINDDKPKIASVYLNRLKKGMKLEADPTVKFALGDFTIRRITRPMLQTASPYNTYMNTGLPPGPICTPAASSIDAVLEAPSTNFLYFCAKDDFSGYSNFAATYEEQLKNARAYQKALDDRNIK